MTQNNEPILQQDLSKDAEFTGVYSIFLLFKEKGRFPETAAIIEKLKSRLGDIDIVAGGDGAKMFALLDHLIEYKDAVKAPSQVLITDFNATPPDLADALTRTQFWDFPDGGELLNTCPFQVMLSDFMARGLHPKERADILINWVELALELFPDCAGVYFQPSGKLLSPEQIKSNPYTPEIRFLYGGVNARFFNIQGTDDMLVDTLGLFALGVPDVQYHFNTLDPNEMVNHAYNVAIYQFQSDAAIKSGHTIDGLTPPQQWKCQYEESLIQPKREVLDIAAGKHAAGRRE